MSLDIKTQLRWQLPLQIFRREISTGYTSAPVGQRMYYVVYYYVHSALARCMALAKGNATTGKPRLYWVIYLQTQSRVHLRFRQKRDEESPNRHRAV